MDQDSFMKGLLRNSRRWLGKHRDSLVLFFGVLTVGALGFEAGFISGMSRGQEPLRIELAPEKTEGVADESVRVPGESGQRIGERLSDTANPVQGTCAFVASRNSKLFHASTCAVVKRIKSENKLCFKDAAEAMARGLKQGCLK